MVFSFYFEMIFRFTVNKMQTHGLHGNKNVWGQVHSKNSLKAASLTPEHPEHQTPEPAMLYACLRGVQCL